VKALRFVAKKGSQGTANHNRHRTNSEYFANTKPFCQQALQTFFQKKAAAVAIILRWKRPCGQPVRKVEP